MRYFLIALLFLLNISVSGHAAPSPEDYGTLPAIHDAALSPDGDRIATIRNFKNSGEYNIEILEGETFSQKTPGLFLNRLAHPLWIKWANNNRILVAVRTNMMRDNTPIVFNYIISIDAKTSDSFILVKSLNNRRQFNANVIDFLDDDPNHILMSVHPKSKGGRSVDSKPEIRKVNVITGNYDVVQKGLKNIQNWVIDRQKTTRVGYGIVRKTRYDKVPETRFIIRAHDEDVWRDVEEYPGLENVGSVFGFTSNPNELIVGQHRNLDTLGLYIYDLGTRTFTRKLYHNAQYDVSRVIYDHSGKNVIGAEYIGDKSTTVLFDTADKNTSALKNKYQGMNIDFIDISASGQRLIYKVSGPSEPGFYVVFDPQTHAIIRFADIYPMLRDDEMGHVENITYTSRDGFEIPSYITLPSNFPTVDALKSAPFIILPHGGPYLRDSKQFDHFAQFFTSRGYAVLQMNFRGSAGYGKKYEEAGRKNWVVMQDDVEDGARWLINQGYADKDRMCIAGWSYGGYAALMGAIKNPELYKCAISMAGVTDLKDMVRDIQKYEYGRSRAQRFILTGFEDKDAIKENSPVKRAGELEIPLFLAHGRIDQRVHFDQFKLMNKALKKSSAKITALALNGEDHFLSDQYNRQIFFKALDAFLADNLGPSEAAP
jgi:dipeptidyl aminopeptidase/acylaminoacyl peptidase